MQKKIIALAIASALTAPAVAMADSVGNVTLYGQANLSVDMDSNTRTSGSQNTNALSSNQSRVGVKGSEDLGGGLTAVFQAEKTINLDDGTSDSSGKLFDRNTYVGIASADMGTVLLGRHDTPYKIATRNLDVFADNLDSKDKGADNRAYIMGSHDIRLDNVLAYVSPSFNGITVAAATEMGAELANNSASGFGKKGTALSLAGMYSANGIYGALAYQSVKAGDLNTGDLAAGVLNTTSADDESKAFKLGGGYTMDAFTVNAVVEKTTDKVASNGDETTGTNWYLGGKYSLSGTDAVKLAYGKHGETTTTGAGNGKNADNAKQLSLGYDHDMSKRTSVYALYTKLTTQDPVSPTSPNPDPSRISVGLKHAF